jgi:hypothetical protein
MQVERPPARPGTAPDVLLGYYWPEPPEGDSDSSFDGSEPSCEFPDPFIAFPPVVVGTLSGAPTRTVRILL